MPSAPFIVLNRSNRRVIHQAASLEAARSFTEGHSKPCAIAMIAETYASAEMDFCIEIVNAESGRVLARSAPLEFNEATDEFLMAKILLVPACLAKGGDV
jgi:hypothetical protein